MIDALARARCATMARLLDAGRALEALGLALGLLAIAAWLLLFDPAADATAELVGLALAALALPAERYLALRLRLDAGLFADLARGTIDTPQDLDDSLAALGLRPPAAITRPLDERLAGALRLVAWHRRIVVFQAVAWIIALLAR